MRIGSRGSRLALAQAEYVSRLLGGPDIVAITTSGDLAQQHAAASPADKSKWVDTIEQALLSGEIDLAVHSAKDLPIEMADGLQLLGSPPRAPAEDVVCGAGRLDRLQAGSIVGTSSLRRRAQLLAAFPELEVRSIGGNVDTRLAKLKAKEGLSAIVLARAGLRRLELEGEIAASLDPRGFVPSPGQGALALQGRGGDVPVYEAAEAITDLAAFSCLRAERAVARALGASCNTPLGVNASPLGNGILLLRAWVGLPDGSAWLSDELEGPFSEPEQLGNALASRLKASGAEDLLRQAEAMAA